MTDYLVPTSGLSVPCPPRYLSKCTNKFGDLFGHLTTKHGPLSYQYHVSVTPNRKMKKRKYIIMQVMKESAKI